jgi:hypothetical protein
VVVLVAVRHKIKQVVVEIPLVFHHLKEMMVEMLLALLQTQAQSVTHQVAEEQELQAKIHNLQVVVLEVMEQHRRLLVHL